MKNDGCKNLSLPYSSSRLTTINFNTDYHEALTSHVKEGCLKWASKTIRSMGGSDSMAMAFSAIIYSNSTFFIQFRKHFNVCMHYWFTINLSEKKNEGKKRVIYFIAEKREINTHTCIDVYIKDETI